MAQLIRASAPAIQRFAFVKDRKVDPEERGLTPAMVGMAKDDTARSYEDDKEFKHHADNATHYIGNLSDGTWVRFSPTGTNLLGERHTKVTLDQVVKAVRAKTFAYEGFTAEPLPEGTHGDKAYQQEAANTSAKFATGAAPGSQSGQESKTPAKDIPLGAESVYPKLAAALQEILPYLSDRNLEMGDHAGSAYQRYLRIAWGVSKDNADTATKSGKLPPRLSTLASTHAKVKGLLDEFIASLKIGGHLGAALASKGARTRQFLAEFAQSFVAAIVDLAPKSDQQLLSSSDAESLATGGTATKKSVLGKWRNLSFKTVLARPTHKNVQFVGMGRKHLDFLVKEGLAENQHAYDMVDENAEDKELTPIKVEGSITGFKKQTAALKDAASRKQ